MKNPHTPTTVAVAIQRQERNMFVDDQFIVAHYSGTVTRWVSGRPPEVVGVYDTNLRGELQNFSVCDTPVGSSIFKVDSRGQKIEYAVVVNEFVHGDAYIPDEYVFVAVFIGFAEA